MMADPPPRPRKRSSFLFLAESPRQEPFVASFTAVVLASFACSDFLAA
jgi:hypothetical protein